MPTAPAAEAALLVDLRLKPERRAVSTLRQASPASGPPARFLLGLPTVPHSREIGAAKDAAAAAVLLASLCAAAVGGLMLLAVLGRG